MRHLSYCQKLVCLSGQIVQWVQTDRQRWRCKYTRRGAPTGRTGLLATVYDHMPAGVPRNLDAQSVVLSPTHVGRSLDSLSASSCCWYLCAVHLIYITEVNWSTRTVWVGDDCMGLEGWPPTCYLVLTTLLLIYSISGLCEVWRTLLFLQSSEIQLKMPLSMHLSVWRVYGPVPVMLVLAWPWWHKVVSLVEL